MKQRKIWAVIVLGIVTLGIYSWYWAVKTKGEMNKLGESIPTAWFWLIPIAGSIYWYWKYSEGVEHVSKEKMSWVLAFILLYLLGAIGQGIVQDSFNKLSPAAPSTKPATPNVAPAAQASSTPVVTPTPTQVQPSNDTTPKPPEITTPSTPTTVVG